MSAIFHAEPGPFSESSTAALVSLFVTLPAIAAAVACVVALTAQGLQTWLSPATGGNYFASRPRVIEGTAIDLPTALMSVVSNDKATAVRFCSFHLYLHIHT